VARIHERKAAKDYPGNGIKKGDKYFYVKIKTGPYSSRTIRSLTRPKRWQLTSSDFYQQLWPIEDERFGVVNEASDLNDIAQELRELGEAQQEKFDAMPDGLQQGDTGQRVEQRATSCGEWADAIENAANDLETKLSAFDTAVEAGDASDVEALQDVDPSDEAAVSDARQQVIQEAVEECENANPGFD
jgi:hypothetical protein